MAKFNEMSLGARLLILAALAAVVGVGYYYMRYAKLNEENQALARQVKDKKAENERLREFEPKLVQLNRDMAILEQQIERVKKVVPEDKDADQFIRLLHDTAATSNIIIRRYTAMPVVSKEFYTEVPFAIDIDGPYYAVMSFFQHVSELERIVNIDQLQMANTKNTGAAKVKTTYPYPPAATVVASCTATTFFSHEPTAPAPAAPGAPGAATTGAGAASAPKPVAPAK